MQAKDTTPSMLKTAVNKVERFIIQALIALMSLLLVLATIELGYTIFKSLLENGDDTIIINLDNLLNVFGVFLLVLIGIELLDTIKVYFKKHVIHVEVVMLVAIIAVARKVIVMDFEKYSGLEILAIGAVILALSAGYYLIKKTGGCGFWPSEKEIVEDIIAEEIIEPRKKALAERMQSIRETEVHNEEEPAKPGGISLKASEAASGAQDKENQPFKKNP